MIYMAHTNAMNIRQSNFIGNVRLLTLYCDNYKRWDKRQKWIKVHNLQLLPIHYTLEKSGGSTPIEMIFSRITLSPLENGHFTTIVSLHNWKIKGWFFGDYWSPVWYLQTHHTKLFSIPSIWAVPIRKSLRHFSQFGH